jgi:hypothetical protein
MKTKLKSDLQDQVNQYYNFVTSMNMKEAIQNFPSDIFLQRQKSAIKWDLIVKVKTIFCMLLNGLTQCIGGLNLDVKNDLKLVPLHFLSCQKYITMVTRNVFFPEVHSPMTIYKIK